MTDTPRDTPWPGPLTLAQAMDDVATIAVKAARDPDAVPHMLHLFADDGGLTLRALAVGGGGET